MRAAVPGNEETPVHGRAVRQRQRRLDARLFDAVAGELFRERQTERRPLRPRLLQTDCHGACAAAAQHCAVSLRKSREIARTAACAMCQHRTRRTDVYIATGSRRGGGRRHALEGNGDVHHHIDGLTVEQRLCVWPFAHRRHCRARKIGMRFTFHADVGEISIQRDARFQLDLATCASFRENRRDNGGHVPYFLRGLDLASRSGWQRMPHAAAP